MQGSQSKALRALAKVISYIFHPVFMPVVMAVVLYKLSNEFAGILDASFNRWLAVIAINTILFPLITVALLKGLGFIKSIHMNDPKDRIIPLIGSMIFYFWANFVIGNPITGAPVILHTLTLGIFLGVIGVFIVNIFYKVSMHTTAAGGMLGILLILMFTSTINMVMPLFIGLLVAGIIGTARLILGAHKMWEIWLGYFLGIASQVAAYLYILYKK